MKKTNQTPKKQGPKAPRRARKSARSVKVDPRWSFELGATEWGPFKTKGAKINSARSMVGLGERAINIQRMMPRLRTTINENGNTVDILTGTDYLTAITSPATSLPGDILFKQEVSPSKFVNTRLLQFSQLYQRYRFRRIKFLYEPVASATQSGQLLGYADFDVDNQINTNSAENLSIGAAHQGQAITQIWQPMEFDMGQVLTFTDLFTEVGSSASDDQRMSIQGVFYLLAASSLPENLSLGNIYVDYEIEFSIPYLSLTSTLLEKQSAGLTTCLANELPGSGSTIQFSSEDRVTGFGPVTLTTTDIGSYSASWTGCRVGDEIVVLLHVHPSASLGMSTLPLGPAPNYYGALTSSQPSIDGGSLLSIGINQWRNASAGAQNAAGGPPPPYTRFAGWGYVQLNIRVTSPLAVNLAINTPVWSASGLGSNPTDPHGAQISWYVVPAVTVERNARINRELQIREAPKKLEAMTRMIETLTNAVARLSQDSPAQPPTSLRGKEKVAEDQRSRFLLHQSVSSAYPQSPRALSPDIRASSAARPRSGSMLDRAIPTRVSDDISDYGAEQEDVEGHSQ